MSHVPTDTAVLVAAARGDRAAVSRVVKENIGCAHYVVNGWLRRHSLPRGWAREDLKQDAIFGMLRAIETYVPSKGTFATYAIHWMKLRLRTTMQRSKGDTTNELYLDQPGVSELTLESAHHDPDPVERSEGDAAVRAAATTIYRRFGARGDFILRRRILADKPLRLDDISAEFGFSRERARQIEKEVLEYLRGWAVTRVA